MTSPRLPGTRRRRSTVVWKACSTIAFLLLSVAVYSAVTGPTANHHQRQRQLDDAYPGSFVDLWPDDRIAESYRNSLWNCIPGDDAGQNCRVRLWKNDYGRQSDLLVALVRPPGRLGDVLVEFIKQVIHLPTKENHRIQLVPISDIIQANHNYSMIVRLATLPALLEAADAALTLNETRNFLSLSMTDWMDLVRYTVRWQCHITLRTQDTALLTITLDRMMGRPLSTTKQVQEFLNITPENPESTKNQVNMKKLPLMVMDRINQASALVQAIQPAVPATTFMKGIAELVEEEVMASKRWFCPSISAVGNGGMASLVQKLA